MLIGSIPIGAIIFGLLFGSALLGIAIARRLPAAHLDSETRTVVSVSMAVVGTMSALVLGLMISSSTASFTTKQGDVIQIAADAVSLDRLLRRYGAEADGVRAMLAGYLAAKHDDLFPPSRSLPPKLVNLATLARLEAVQDGLLSLVPGNDRQRWLRDQALQLQTSITASRWDLVRAESTQYPRGLLVVVMFWFVILFLSFGLFAPVNTTAIVALMLCAMGVGAAIRMTTELQIPFSGLIRVNGAPLVQALDAISR